MLRDATGLLSPNCGASVVYLGWCSAALQLQSLYGEQLGHNATKKVVGICSAPPGRKSAPANTAFSGILSRINHEL
jgi:hypothetical protein